MNPTAEDLEGLKAEIKAAVLAEIKRRLVEQILKDNEERINHYFGLVRDEFVKEITKEFPL